MYAKLINGTIEFAPKKIKQDESTIYNPPVEMLLQKGYKPIIETPMPEPEEGYYYELSYKDEGEQIVYVWTLVKAEPSAEEIINILTGEAE